MPTRALIACPDCDLLQRRRPLQVRERARCARCGALLYADKPDSVERTLALAVTGLILFVLSNFYPFMTFELQGQSQQNVLLTGVRELYAQGMWGLAALVLMVSILAPLLKMTGMLYVLLPLRLGRRPWLLPQAFRALDALDRWAMLEVYMLGVLVAFVKLRDIATIVPGVALYAFGALILVMAAATASLDPAVVWERLERRP